MSTLYLSAAFVALSLLLLVVRRIFNRRGIKHIPGPTSPSLLFGHDYTYACQEEACTWWHSLIFAAAGARACIGWRFSVIEMQAFTAELVENFQFDPPAEKVEIQRALSGLIFAMFPVVKGQADRGGALPMRISLAQ